MADLRKKANVPIFRKDEGVVKRAKCSSTERNGGLDKIVIFLLIGGPVKSATAGAKDRRSNVLTLCRM